MNDANQLAMFDDAAAPDAARSTEKLTPGCLLPVQQAQLVDVARVAKILCVSMGTVRLMADRGTLPAFRLAERQSWAMPYEGIVAFCDRLRTEFMIRDRRPRLAAGARRWRDSELLPFSWDDTITAPEAATGFDVRIEVIHSLITDRAAGEYGAFDAYRLSDCSPWRISRSSLLAYSAHLKRKLHAQMAGQS